MADRKITDLTALAAGSQATGDLVTIVDVSESAAADKNKKMTMENLFKGIPGDVGIGTSAPSQNLHIFEATDGDVGIRIQNNDGFAELEVDTDELNYNADSHVFNNQADSAERMRIDGSGNVGIGESTPAAGLDVKVDTNPVLAIDRGSANTANFNLQYNGTLTGQLSAADADFQVSAVGSSTPISFYANGSERMQIDSSGRLLLGASSTTGNQNDADLLVTGSTQGELYLSRGSAPGNSGSGLGFIKFTGNNGADAAEITCFSDGGTWTNGSSHPTSLRFNTTADGASSTTERMRIDSSGRVGIGTTSPNSSVQIGNFADNQALALAAGTANSCAVYFADGTGADLYRGYVQYSHVDDSLQFGTSSTERGRFDSSGRLLVGTTSATHGSAATAEFAGTNTDYIFSLTNTTASDSEGHRFSYLAFTGTQSGGEKSILASVNGAHDGTGDDTKGMLVFRTNSGSESGTIPTERMRINRFGTIGMGTGGFDTSYRVNIINTSAGGGLAIMNSSSDNDTSVAFRNSGQGTIGSITTSNTATAYNTSSDYRLKENVVDLDGAISRVKQLAPKRFNFIADDSTTVDGFLAHEAATVVPEAVTGTHNEVDDDNNPVYQGIDQSKLVPLLTAALQEAIAKIETLETKVAALEAQ